MQTDIKKILDRLDTFLTNDITNFYGLLQGQLGFVLYHIYYYKYTCSEKTKDVIVKKIEDIFDNMSNNNLHSSLATGFTGLYYVLSLLVSENILNKEVLNGNISIKKYIKECEFRYNCRNENLYVILLKELREKPLKLS